MVMNDTLNNNDLLVSETYHNPFESQNSDPETQPNEYLQQELETEDTQLRQLHQEVNETLNLPHTQTELRTPRQTDNNTTAHTEQLQLTPSTSRRAPPMQKSRAETQVPFPVYYFMLLLKENNEHL